MSMKLLDSILSGLQDSYNQSPLAQGVNNVSQMQGGNGLPDNVGAFLSGIGGRSYSPNDSTSHNAASALSGFLSLSGQNGAQGQGNQPQQSNQLASMPQFQGQGTQMPTLDMLTPQGQQGIVGKNKMGILNSLLSNI